ncbi:YdaS family helix-turn-helix protein [Antarcticirhabdus aurantiaca]
MSKQRLMEAALIRAVDRVGGPAAVGRSFAISSQAVGQWKVCPHKRVIELERLSGVSRFELRPDLYPLEAGASVAAVHGNSSDAGFPVAEAAR